MHGRTLGDVEILVVRLASDHLRPTTLEALLRLVEAGALQILDVVMARRRPIDAFDIREVDDAQFALAGLPLLRQGLLGNDDVRQLTFSVPLGAWVALVLVEATWVPRIRRDLVGTPDTLAEVRQIPAAVANAAWDHPRQGAAHRSQRRPDRFPS